MGNETQKPVDMIVSKLLFLYDSHGAFPFSDVTRALNHERQIAEKLREENEKLKKTVSLPEHVVALREAFQKDWAYNFEKLEVERDGLREQVSSLVGALNFINHLANQVGEQVGFSIRAQRVAQKVLAILPSHHLEISKAKEDVIEAAYQMGRPHKHACPGFDCAECNNTGLFEALDNLQAKQEESK